MLKNRFVLLWICSAMVVTFAQLFHVADLYYDFTIQFQAAQHFLAGRGLSIYSPAGEEDLARPSHLITLTHFPSGYSIFAVTFLSLGLSVGSVMKVGGVAGTMFGWWGWARLAHSFCSEGMRRGRAWKWAASAIAICTPLLMTPAWHGTDIFLWAAVPWVLEWVVKASNQNIPRRLWFDLLAGALCGFCIWMRYTSLFLAGYAALLILCQSRGDIKITARRWAAFAAGLLPLITFQLYLIIFMSAPGADTGGVNLSERVGIGQIIWRALCSLPAANDTVVWWMPRKIHELFISSAKQARWLLAVTPLLFAVPVLVAVKLAYRDVVAASRDVRTAAAGLFILVPVFFFACAMLGQVYVGARRYYLPLIPLALLIAYMLAVADRKGCWGGGFVRVVSVGYLAGYLCMAAAGLILLMSPGVKGDGRRAKFLSTSDILPWPSTGLTYEFSASRKYVLDLLKDKPDTILVTNVENWFYAEPSVDRSRLHSLQGMRATCISGPARVIIMARDFFPAPTEALYWFNAEYNVTRPAPYFDGVPDMRLLKRFLAEDIKILEFSVPSGSRIALNR